MNSAMAKGQDMVLSAIFNTISAISWRSVLLVGFEKIINKIY
jgi:hypothetical protein